MNSDASDLPSGGPGLPPAFRVNGEIIIADEGRADRGRNHCHVGQPADERQKKKFGEEWGALHFAAAQRGGTRARHVLPAQRTPGMSFPLLRATKLALARGTRPAGKN